MNSTIARAASSVCIFAAIPAATGTFTCNAKKFCWTGTYSTPKGCQEDTRVFEVLVEKRRMTLAGDGLNLVLKEARPYWQDVDWYQSGMTDTRGLINFAFDNEADRPSFSLEQMIEGSVQRKLWTLEGNCEVKN